MDGRNVVILGPVGAGKRTLGNHIVGEQIFQQKGTGNASSQYREHRTEETLYRILTVHTGGLQTGYCNPLPYIRDRFEKIHLLIFVIANGRYTNESHVLFKRTINSFHARATQFSALVITHCEGITDEERRGIIEEFQTDNHSSQVAAFFGKQIYTVGLPNISKSSPESMSIYENGIAGDEMTIRRLVKECIYSIEVQNLPAVQPNFFDHCCESLRRLWESCSCSCSMKCLIVVCCFPVILIYICCHSL